MKLIFAIFMLASIAHADSHQDWINTRLANRRANAVNEIHRQLPELNVNTMQFVPSESDIKDGNLAGPKCGHEITCEAIYYARLPDQVCRIKVAIPTFIEESDSFDSNYTVEPDCAFQSAASVRFKKGDRIIDGYGQPGVVLDTGLMKLQVRLDDHQDVSVIDQRTAGKTVRCFQNFCVGDQVAARDGNQGVIDEVFDTAWASIAEPHGDSYERPSKFSEHLMQLVKLRSN